MGIKDAILGKPAKQSSLSTSSSPADPFITGYGNGGVPAFQRQYVAPVGYNPAAFPGMLSTPATTQAATTYAPEVLAQLPPEVQQYLQSTGAQAPAGTSDPTGTSGGVNNLGDYGYNYRTAKTGLVPSGLDKGTNIPGLLPAAANEFLNGPAAYYPYFDVAGKSQGMQSADDVLNYFSQLTAQGKGAIANQQNIADQMQWLSGAAGGKANEINPTMDVAFNPNGLSDFLNYYTASPGIEGVINAGAADATRIMNESLLPQDRAAAISGGQYGSSRSGIAEGITRRGVGEEIAQLANQTRYNDYQNYLANKLSAGGQILQGDIGAANAGANRFNAAGNLKTNLLGLQSDYLTGAAGLNQNIYNQGMDLNNQLYSRGVTDRAIQQAMIDADKARWDTGQNQVMDWLGKYASLLYGAPQQSASKQSQTGGQMGIADYAIAAAKAAAPFVA